MKSIKTLLIALFALFVAFVVGWFSLFNIIQNPLSTPDTLKAPPFPTEISQQSISLTIDYGDGNKVTYETQETNNTAFGLLEKIANEENVELVFESFDFGIFVKSLGGLESNADMAWIYFVNGQSADVASDKYDLNPGDVVEWRYIKSE